MIGVYLNDHLAGSVSALEMLGHLEPAYPELADFVARLRADIEEDQAELKALLQKLGIGRSLLRRAAGWLTEKIAELKLRLDDPAKGALRLLEALETLSLGIEGKRGLWLALEKASALNPNLQGLNYERLRKRAEDQRARVEQERLKAALAVFGTLEGSGR
jgi:uncharacterized protein Smg (DUF494 family)